MNVDRLPDDSRPDADDPRPDAESTDSPAPENPAPSNPEHHRRAERAPEQERKPDQEQQPDKRQDPATEHPPESSPTETDSPAPIDAPHPAEPRTRQEHASPIGRQDRRQEDVSLPQDDRVDHGRQVDPDVSDHSSAVNHPENATEGDESEHQPLGQGLPEHAESDKDNHSLRVESAEAFRPLTDREYAEHVSEVRERLFKAHEQGLSTECLHTIDPDHLRWTRERRQIHSEITETIYACAEHVPCDGKAIIAGGLGGAGKTTVLREEADVDLSQYLMINPDNIKEELARRGLVPAVEGLSPMEATDLAHEESSAIAKQLARRAYMDGKNVIWDITMSSTESTEERLNDLRNSGYTKVEGIFVDIPVDLSIVRSQARHRQGHEDFRSGRGLGGRFVPPEVIKSQADSVWGSQNRKTFESVKQKFDYWTRYDNSADGHRARLVDQCTQ